MIAYLRGYDLQTNSPCQYQNICKQICKQTNKQTKQTYAEEYGECGY